MKKYILSGVVSLFLIASCSTKKNTFLGRNFHSLTTKYNILYNGNIALEKGIKELQEQYQDNFWEILPVEPLHIDEDPEIKIPKDSDDKNQSKSNFEIAEEKAVKAIQKHGMFIDGVEYNKQIDAAYLLLGKARYYSQRFVPALEAFDFLLKTFQNDNLSNDLRIWKAKTQVRLQSEERGIKTLRNLIHNNDIKDKTKEDAHTALAMAYLAIDSTRLAIQQLEHATQTAFDKSQHARNLFILGQLYRKEGSLDTSSMRFQDVIDFKKAPEKYKMQAYFEKVKNITDSTDYTALKQQLEDMIKVYENKKYLGELYYYLAKINFKDHADSIALRQLTKSTHAPLVSPFQMGLSYELAGNYYFDRSQYVKSGAYYDSTLATATELNTKRIRKLRRKRKSMDELIQYETLLQKNDSILKLVAMPEEARRAFFQAYIDKLKKKAEIEAIQKENAERMQNSGGVNGLESGPAGANTGAWYFYNTQTVAFGKSSFKRIWGNRKLQDNWRWSSENNEETTDEQPTKTDPNSSLKGMAEAKMLDIDTYLNAIPKDPEVIQKLRDENSEALYQLGLIYKEKFKENELAIARLERFLSEKPLEKHILPAKYHLYQIYKKTANPKAEALKKQIIAAYPDSRFTKMLESPEKTASDQNEDAPERQYEKVYCDYEYEKYASVKEQCEQAIKRLDDHPIKAKYELLKSYAIYHLEGKKTFMENLKYVVENFPKTDEAIHAQDMLDFLNGVKKRIRQKRIKESFYPTGKTAEKIPELSVKTALELHNKTAE